VVTRQFGSHAESLLDLGVRNALALVELGQPRIDLRQEHEPFDGVINCRVGREILQGFQNSVPRHSSSHTRGILALA